VARTPTEVAYRALALFGVANAAYEQPPATARGWLQRYGVACHLSPWEEAFLAQDSPPDELIFAASWRTESLQVLTWALGMIDQLPPPSERANLSHIGLTPEILAAPDSFASSATLRSEDELEAARAEMTSHHWGVRAGPAGRRLFGHPEAESSFDPGVVEQRHYAIEWLVGPESQEWDHVRTDT
jgi:Domain of unknown function (DUF4272)